MDDFKNTSEETFKPPKFILKFWAGFHNAIILAMLFTMFGVAIGVKVSKDFYINKIDEIVQTGAMLHQKKVYIVNPKL